MPRTLLVLLLILSAPTPLLASLETVETFQFELPKLVLKGIPFKIEVRAINKRGETIRDFEGEAVLEGACRLGQADLPVDLTFARGRAVAQDLVLSTSGRRELTIHGAGIRSTTQVRSIPGILSVLPPLTAIALALVFRQWV